jgi:iron complex transport system ATP-binding protein
MAHTLETPVKPLEARELRVGYKKRIILGPLNLSLGSGELLVLIGPNGIGKTTLLKTLAGLLPPVDGEVLLDGKALSQFTAFGRSKKIAFLSQNAPLSWPFTVEELVAQGRFPYRRWFGVESQADKDAVEEALDRACLRELRHRLATELSGGELQRVLIARSIAQRPQILVLDEPVSQLDPKFQITAMDLIKNLTQGGLAAITSLHDLNLAALYADRIALFSEGTLLALGKPQDVLREDLLLRAFGSELVIGNHPRDGRRISVYHPLPKAF